jgi:carbon storage regulator
MLVLSRKLNEAVMIGDNIKITVIDFDKGRVRLGIEADRDIPVHRIEVYNSIQAKNEQS